MRLPATLGVVLTALVATATGLAACSKKMDSSMMPAGLTARQPMTTASYRLDGKLITCKVVVYPPFPVYNGEQLTVRLYPYAIGGSDIGIGTEYLDLCFVKQPTEPSSAYKTNWVRYNSANLPAGGMLVNDAVLKIEEGNAGGFSGTASGKALFANAVFTSLTDVVFTNAQVLKY